MTASTETRRRDRADTKFGGRLLAALFVLSFAVGLDVSSVAVVNAALPDIGRELGITEAALQWVMTGYAVTFAGFLLLGGRLADVFSRRFTFALGIGLFTAAALVGALSPTPIVLVLARAVQGIGAAISGPAALALLFQTFREGALRNKALAIYSGIGSASFSVGLVGGGVLTSAFGWRSVFVFNLLLGALVLVGVPLLPRGQRANKPLDLLGVTLITAGLVLAVLGISRGGEVGWNAANVLLVVAAVVLVVAFVLWERRAADPLLKMSIFRSPAVQGATIGVLVFYTACISVMFFTPLYMQEMLGYEPFESGLAIAPMGIVVGIAAPVGALLLNRIGQRSLLVMGLLIQALGALSFLRTTLDSSYWTDIMPGFALMGLGQGFAYSAFTSASLTGVPGEQHGVAGAFNITAQQVGAAVGTAALVGVAASATTGPDNAGLLHGFHVAYLTTGIVSAIGIVLIMLIPGFGRVRTHDVEPVASTEAAVS